MNELKENGKVFVVAYLDATHNGQVQVNKVFATLEDAKNFIQTSEVNPPFTLSSIPTFG